MEPKTEAFIKLIDQALETCEQMRSQGEDTEQVSHVATALQSVKTAVLTGQLEPSRGFITLGLSRGVADWIESLDSPLLKSVGAIEAYYQKHL